MSDIHRKDGKATIIEASELRRWIKTFPTIGREATAALPLSPVSTQGTARPTRLDTNRKALARRRHPRRAEARKTPLPDANSDREDEGAP
jgi:hypothetical protein